MELKRTSKHKDTPKKNPSVNHEHDNIKKWLKDVKFKRQHIGGVDEVDVWKKIAELNDMYEHALSAERARYDALIAEAVDVKARELAKKLYLKTMENRDRR